MAFGHPEILLIRICLKIVLKRFPTKSVILYATEIPMTKPSDVNSLSITSDYKHGNTLKRMISCTSRDAVSFISNSYGGSASDRQIIESLIIS